MKGGGRDKGRLMLFHFFLIIDILALTRMWTKSQRRLKGVIKKIS